MRERATRGVLLLAFATLAMAQTEPGELLLRVRDRVLRTVDTLPRYLCTQTIDRSQYEPDRPVFVRDCDDLGVSSGTRWKLLHTVSDRLRLDVTVAAQRELYSWVGEKQFGDRSLSAIVNEGSISTGYFQGFLEMVFRSDRADFSYTGEVSVAGRVLMAYRYSVPLEASHYAFGPRGREVMTAYDGSILVDPQTADLVRLTVRTAHLPSQTGSCEATTRMEFGRFHLHETDFLLPSRNDLEIKNLNGVEKRNRTVYSGCREFLGESTLTFGTATEAAGGPGSPNAARTVLPAGIPFTIVVEDIDSATAATGDPVKGTLTADLRDGKKVLVPKGTPVLCRILRLRHFHYARDNRAVGTLVRADRLDVLLRLESFALSAGPLPISARLDISRRSRRLGTLDDIGTNQWLERFYNVADDFVVKGGPPWNWITVAP